MKLNLITSLIIYCFSIYSRVHSSLLKNKLKTSKAELASIIDQIQNGHLFSTPLLYQLDKDYQMKEEFPKRASLRSDSNSNEISFDGEEKYRFMDIGTQIEPTTKKNVNKQTETREVNNPTSKIANKDSKSSGSKMEGNKKFEKNKKAPVPQTKPIAEDTDVLNNDDEESDGKLLFSVDQINSIDKLQKTTPKDFVIQEADIEDCNYMWSYSNKGNDWECLCQAGANQSPINIDIENKKSSWIPLKTNILINFYNLNYGPKQYEVLNNGATIKLIGNFGRLVLPPTNMVYECEDIHFHSPAEHTIDGIRNDLEMHITFRVSGRYEISKINNPFVIISVFFKLDGSNDNVFLEKLELKSMPLRRSESVIRKTQLNFEYLFSPKYSNMTLVKEMKEVNQKINFEGQDEKDIMSLSYKEYDTNFPLSSFFIYHGSFTTPSCDESVTYIINENVYPISDIQLKTLRKALFNGEESKPTAKILRSNYRNIQPRNNREIFYFNNNQNEMSKLFDNILKLSKEDNCDLNKTLVGIKKSSKNSKLVLVNDKTKAKTVLEGDAQNLKQIKYDDDKAKLLRILNDNTVLKDISDVNFDFSKI